MAMMLQCGVVEQRIAGLMDMLMAHGTASTESKFLSLSYRVNSNESGEKNENQHTVRSTAFPGYIRMRHLHNHAAGQL